MALLLGLFFAAVGTVTVGIFLAKVWWLPELISVHGAAIDDQMVMTLIIAGTVFFLAQITLGYFIWKFRGQGGKASNWHENPKLEFTWTAITLVIFLSLGISGNRIWAQYFQTPVPKDAVMVELTAQQFAWNIRYPGADGVLGRTNPALIDDAAGNYIGLDPKDPAGKDDVITQNLMGIPVNRPIRLMLRSKDVTHSFFVPQLRVKQDAVPGLSIGVSFTATKTGEYEIACAELCDMAFPFMNMMSFWVTFVSFVVMLMALFAVGGAPIAGWTAYTPLSAVGVIGGPELGTGQTLWIISIPIFCAGSLLTALNFLTTVLNLRARGMSLMRMPLTSWAWFTTAILALLAFPVLLAGGVLLMLDRVGGTSFFIPAGLVISDRHLTNSGGSPLLWQHLFWFFGHPEVYIAILPGMGVTSHILS